MNPSVSSNLTMDRQLSTGRQPGILNRTAMRLVLNHMEKITRGSLAVVLPNGTWHQFGDPDTQPRATMEIRSWDFFRRVALDGDIGFGEAYMDGLWESQDLTACLSVFATNLETLDEKSIWTSRLLRGQQRIRHFLNRNTLVGSRRNIQRHYDLSNDFFRLMLDPTMAYSCALFRSERETLEQAQLNKIDALIEKAQLRETDHLLEIGSGWGELAIRAVKTTGCRVTTITLSEEQLRVVEERVRQEGLEGRILPMLCDYRELEGQFDKIISVEMLEAVGHEYLPTFFARVDELLKPDGIAVIQVITIPDQRYDDYRRNTDWIQQYIFPGAVVPSLTAMTNAMTNGSRLLIEGLENIGIHYARTLREWRQNIHRLHEHVSALGFDERFLRMWDYYLCYCEAGFASRRLGVLQLQLSRPGNSTLPVYTKH